MAFRGRTHHSLRKSLLFISRCILNHVVSCEATWCPPMYDPQFCPAGMFALCSARCLRGMPILVVNPVSLSWAHSNFPVLDHGMTVQVSSITSSSSTPAGVRPSLRSFSSLVISARVLAFLISASNLALSFSFSLTFGCLAAPFASGAM